MKVWKYIKGALYVIITFCVMFFADFFVANVRYLVGGLMLLYSIPEIIIFSVIIRTFKKHNDFIWALLEFVLAIVMLFFVEDYESICVTWGIWSILRETIEVEEAIDNLYHHRPGIISIVESIVCTYFSITLVIHPGEHHAMIHAYYILPLELISTGVVYPLLDLLCEKVVHKKVAAKDKEKETEEDKEE